MEITVKNNPLAHRFEAEVAGSLAFLDYVLGERSITLVHTEVPSALEGQGIGGKIVKAALDFAQSHGLQVVPRCPFVSVYIERHQEYAGLVDT